MNANGKTGLSGLTSRRCACIRVMLAFACMVCALPLQAAWQAGLKGGSDAVIPLRHGTPIRFGTKGLVWDPGAGRVRVAEVNDVGESALLVHDAHAEDPTMAFAISRLTSAGRLERAPIGIFRQVVKPAHDDLVRAQVASVRDGAAAPESELADLLEGGDAWTVG